MSLKIDHENINKRDTGISKIVLACVYLHAKATIDQNLATC